MGTHPIFESDFDCLTEKCLQNSSSFVIDPANMLVQDLLLRWRWLMSIMFMDPANPKNMISTAKQATTMYAKTRGAKSTKLICSVFVGCLLALSIVVIVLCFIVLKENEQGRSATNTTVAWNFTTVATTTPSAWSDWSRCSAECSSSLNSDRLECPTKKRYRTNQDRKETDIAVCNC